MAKRTMVMVVGVIVMATVVAQADYTANLVARWTFTGLDPLMDDVGTNSSLTAGTGVSFTNGQAVFNGTSTATLNAGVGSGGELDITPDITVWMRVNIPSNTGQWNMNLFGRWGDEWVLRSYSVYVRPDNGYLQTAEGYEGSDNGTIVRRFGPSVYNPYDSYFGGFADVAFVWSSAEEPDYAWCKLFVNGALFQAARVARESAPATTGIWHSATQSLVFGSLQGTVEEIRVYNAALTGSQLSQIEYVPETDFTTGLVSRWTFNGPDYLMDDVGDNSSLTQGSGVTFNNGQAIFDGTAGAKLNAGVGAGGELDITPDITLWIRVNIPAGTGIWNILFDRWGPEWINRPYLAYIRPDNNYLSANEGYEGWNGTQIVRKDGPLVYGTYPNFGSFAEIAYVWNHVDPFHPGYASWDLYINGTRFAWHEHVPVESAPATTGIWHDPTQPLVFGSLQGTVEEIRVYNRALTDFQLREIKFVPGWIPVVATPTFSPDGGTYTSSQTVTIQCATDNATIRYTTDGSDPLDNSTVYTVPITVDHSLTLKAKAWAAGILPSGIKSATYAFVTNQADIPQCTLTIDGDLSDWPAPVSNAWSYPFVWWNGDGLASTTRAKFAWNDADDMLYVAVQTNETSVQNGGHLVIGPSKNINSNPSNGTDSTQLCFDTQAGGNNVLIRNEIYLYDIAIVGTDGVQAKYSYDGVTGFYTYEIAIPLWTNWGTMATKQSLSSGETIYAYGIMQETFGTINGMDLSWYGNPHFGDGAFSKAAALTLRPYSYTAVDLAALLAAMDSKSGDGNWNGLVDLDHDGEVTSTDLSILLAAIE